MEFTTPALIPPTLTSTTPSLPSGTVLIANWETTGLLETLGVLAMEKKDILELRETPMPLNVELTLLLLMEPPVLEKLNLNKYVDNVESCLIPYIQLELKLLHEIIIY